MTTRIKLPKGNKTITSADLDASIVDGGVLPQVLELDLVDYLEVAGFVGVSYQPDGLYYKGIRLNVTK